MLPKEHGAYGQLLFPLVTALAVGRPDAVALLLTTASVCAFLAHEPLLVLLGQRGAHVGRERRSAAVLWFGGFAAGAAVFGFTGVGMAPHDVRVTLLVPAVLAVILLFVIVARREHTTVGEVLSSIALSSLALPVARASGAPMASAVTCGAVFSAAFVCGTLSVRAVIAHTRRPPAWGARAVAGTVAAASIAALWMLASAGAASGSAPWAALPVCGGGALIVLMAPSARHLRTIGWVLVAATTASAVLLVAALR